MQSIKDSFISYLKIQSPLNSGKPGSYVKAMEIIEDVLFDKKFSKSISIWEFINSENIEQIYSFVQEQQGIQDGVFKDYTPASYWKKGFCSAALKEFGLYLNKQEKKTFKLKIDVNDFNILEFTSSLSMASVFLSETLPFQFVSALQTKPFIILTGLSGSGKTKLAEAFSLWISESEDQYCMIAVGADWTNREPLLGFPNALEQGEYIKPDSGALDLVLRAQRDSEKPYFLILDEMNMSHVERYFADFLSAMESTDRMITLHPDTEEWNECDVPASLKLPENLFIIGTVNIDETTYMFSPKVLDRANVIEFRVSNSEMKSYFDAPKVLDMESLRGAGASMGTSFVAKAKEKGQIAEGLKDKLMPFFEKLQEAGAEFGYRTALEISRFVAIYTDLAKDNSVDENEVIDAAIMQKLLPKLHGSRNKIEKILKALGGLCLISSDKLAFQTEIVEDDIKYPLSYQKLKRMHARVIADGFTSFAEA